MAKARPSHGSANTGSPSSAGHAAGPPRTAAALATSSTCTDRHGRPSSTLPVQVPVGETADRLEGGSPMQHFAGKLAVVTGGGTGMGRELARQLSAEGCHVAMCDVSATAMADTQALCEETMPAGTVVSTFVADVSDESQLVAFREHVASAHRHRAHRPAVQQRRHRRRREPGSRRPRRVGAGVRRLLGRRLPGDPHVPADAARQRSRPRRQHEQRQRLLGHARRHRRTPPTAPPSSPSRGSPRR